MSGADPGTPAGEKARSVIRRTCTQKAPSGLSLERSMVLGSHFWAMGPGASIFRWPGCVGSRRKSLPIL